MVVIADALEWQGRN